MNFASRTNWHLHPNRLTQLLDDRRRSGKPIFDLTNANPTEAGIEYPVDAILSALACNGALRYQPDPRGMLLARQAVGEYYAAKGLRIDAGDVILTASTSEAYAFVFKLLCNYNDEVLVPTPSYPLFEYLAQLGDVRIRPYLLSYDGEWHFDIESVRRAVSDKTRAVVVVSPHNPSGMVVKRDELLALSTICAAQNLALIVDEVFADFIFNHDDRHVKSAVVHNDVLTFTLNGISKSCGLPQLKLGWTVVSGPANEKSEALQRLEIIADTFLSVNTPVQVGLSRLLREGASVRERIRSRVRMNAALINRQLMAPSTTSLLSFEGGWNAVLKIPKIVPEEHLVTHLIQESGVYVFPGHYFDFQDEGYLILSLLTKTEILERGVQEILNVMRQQSPLIR